MITYINERSHSEISVGQRMERDPDKVISPLAKTTLENYYKDIYDLYEYSSKSSGKYKYRSKYETENE